MYFVTCTLPQWFLGFQIIFQLLFAGVTFFIGYYAYRLYRVARQQSLGFFSLAFAGISLGYLVQTIFNVFFWGGLKTQHIFNSFSQTISSSTQISVFVVLFHMLAMITGLVMLAFVTLRRKDLFLFSFLLTMTLVTLMVAHHIHHAFFIITGLLLLFITLQHLTRYTRKPSRVSLYVTLGFSLLFLGQLGLGLSSFTSALYVWGHVVTFVGYLFLFWSVFEGIKYRGVLESQKKGED
ncbi:MAG: hypothetical protein ACOCQQ_03650 [Candidatus Nanoarchaeia archaeon]